MARLESDLKFANDTNQMLFDHIKIMDKAKEEILKNQDELLFVKDQILTIE